MKVTAYLVLRANRGRYKVYQGKYKGQQEVQGVSLNRVLQKQPAPSSLSATEVCVPIELEVPVDWFYQQVPQTVVIDLPEPEEPEPVEIPSTPTVQSVVRGRARTKAASVVKP